MGTSLIIVGSVLIVLLFAGRWFTRTSPAKVTALVRRFGLVVGALILIALVATGRLHWLIGLIGGLLPFAQRFARVLRAAQWLRNKTASPRPEPVSAIETRYLRMTLDHDSGELSGLVLDGRFKGKRLNEMTIDELAILLGDCRIDDTQAADLLETYLQRIYGSEWQQKQQQPPQATSSDMTRDEALAILGLTNTVTDLEIRDAHRRLMQKLHPDRGGSDYLAAQINKAKAVLLGE